jgi:hypothetical protein
MKLPLALLLFSSWLAHSQTATYYLSNSGSDSHARGAQTVQGYCGTANGTTVSSAPRSNLCYSGTASVVAGTGPWSWICSGSTINTTNFEYCSAQTSASTLGVSAFLSSLGVNTHVNFPGTPYYGDPQTVLSALQYLGINTIRDVNPGYSSDPTAIAGYDTLASMG